MNNWVILKCSSQLKMIYRCKVYIYVFSENFKQTISQYGNNFEVNTNKVIHEEELEVIHGDEIEVMHEEEAEASGKAATAQ